MKRVFAIDVLVCPHCSGAHKLIALLTDGLVVRKIMGVRVRKPCVPTLQ